MSKAQEKRDKQLRESLTRRLGSKLLDFREGYLTDYAEYNLQKLESEKERLEELMKGGEALELLNKVLLSKTRESMKRWFQPKTPKSFEHELKAVNRKLSIPAINNMNWYNEAQENYTQKLERVVEKLVQYQIDTYKMKIESIGGGTNRDFGFLISDNEKVVHARVIYACGEIKAPHYRFIVTKRK